MPSFLTCSSYASNSQICNGPERLTVQFFITHYTRWHLLPHFFSNLIYTISKRILITACVRSMTGGYVFTGVYLLTRRRGTPVSAPRSLPSIWFHVLSGGVPQPLVARHFQETPQSQVGVTPECGTPRPGQDWGTPQARTGVPTWLRLGYPTLRLWYPPLPGLVTPRTVCLLRFPAGLSCYAIISCL